MAMTADIKMQIEAIKNPERLTAIDYGDTVLLTDGWKGPYIKKENALINFSKIKCVENAESEFNPNHIKIIKINRTNHLLVASGGRIVNRFDTEDGEHIWARNDWLEEYGNAFSYATVESKHAIIPIGMSGELLGIVLCMRINKEII